MTTRDDTDDLDDLDAELLAELVDSLAAAPPSASLKDRLMKSIESEGRFGERFAERMAVITDLARDKAKELLDAIDDAARWVEGGLLGVNLFHIDGGPRVAGAIVGFVRMAPGAVFPEHTHVGHETVLVIQGGFIDSSGAVHRAGEEVNMAAGSTHSFTAAPGPDLVYLGVVRDGFDIGEAHFGPDSPDA